ncbi:putative gamma-glutamyltranspeptidase 1 [Amylocarpus encephaloides]|uniref:Glutathione hydrolase n=1 Tax=Amylocarpus encephaloides TaxID=45428 RepID=A0A9P7YEB3_9HELO|nr:putative gamma-glutamyltranspeptidase 1 [Amylocarpus encephaloides]
MFFRSFFVVFSIGCFKMFSSAVVLFGLGVVGRLVAASPINGFRTKSNAKLGAIASESSICSAIGIDILKAGGNAADSLVATQFCVGVIGMYHSGIGGGGFMTIRSASGSFEFVDFREMAPAAAFETMYSPPLSSSNLSLYSGLASGVPGELRGLEHLHTKYGKLPWKHLVLPSVKLARHGFPVTRDLVNYMASATSSYDYLTYDETWAIDFAPNGTRLGLGDTMTRKRYANTLESIAEKGPDVFYLGALANATIVALQKSNGTMTLTDLANYTIEIRPTSNITYRGFRLHSGSAPSSGAVVLSALKIVEGYDMSSPAQLNLSTHYLDEAMRFAYGQRTLLGDATFLPNLTTYQQKMYSEATAAVIRTNIDPLRTLNSTVYNPTNYGILTDDGTSATVATDKSGLTIACTSTINTLFGSRLMVPETGVIMNNEMNDFSIPNTTNAFGYIPTQANFIRPFKRPLSSISPTIVEYPNGQVFVSHASAGGSRIITEIIQHLWHVMDQNMTSAEALAQPRFHDQLSPNTVSFEYTYNDQTTAFFKEIGANVAFTAPGGSTAQALRMLPNGTFEAAGEPRQLNSAGYAI